VELLGPHAIRVVDIVAATKCKVVFLMLDRAFLVWEHLLALALEIMQCVVDTVALEFDLLKPVAFQDN
jgi:hypothetical protein